jgi:hypothetical protein
MNLFQVGFETFSTVKLRFAARLPDIPRLYEGYCVNPIRQTDSHHLQVDAIGPTGLSHRGPIVAQPRKPGLQ